MKTLRHILIALVTLVVLSACSDSNRVTINVDTPDGRELTLRAVTYTPDGVHTAMLATRSGHCAWQEEVPETDPPQPVYIELYSNDYRLLGVVSANAGDELRLTPDPEGIKGFKIERDGDATPFDSAIGEFVASIKGRPDNTAVERFVRRHPDNPAAYAVLTTLYDASGSPEKAVDLLAALRPEARPAYYDNGFATLAAGIAARPTRLDSYSVLSLGDTIVNIDPRSHRLTLIAFTGDEQEHTDSVVPLLRRLARRTGRNLIVEHSLLPDTITWHRTARTDTATWTSVWSGSGTGALGVGQHAISTLPHFVVADSTGLILYSGPSANAAARHFTGK